MFLFKFCSYLSKSQCKRFITPSYSSLEKVSWQKKTGANFTMASLAHKWNLLRFFLLYFCTYDQWGHKFAHAMTAFAVMACAKLWPDYILLIIIINLRTKHFFNKICIMSSQTLCEMRPTTWHVSQFICIKAVANQTTKSHLRWVS